MATDDADPEKKMIMMIAPFLPIIIANSSPQALSRCPVIDREGSATVFCIRRSAAKQKL